MQAANEILHAYLQVSRRISEELRGHYGKQNLTFPQTLVLTLLDSDGPMPISALARATGSANSTISGVVDRLENAGLLRRVRSEQDRRVIFVEVTDKYREIQEESHNYALSRFSRSMDTLNEDELRQILNGLSLMQQAFERTKKEND
ncbi:MAG: MarR family transcriptional regulator [Clostridiales bacterium]|nr:MarR family transcriptional regulator [Clostridiales bacterium]